ncbi:AMP-dependent synthetase/ligase [Baekduia soli]|uniref:AMP-dependent synthetase/ligase n=1 Tax=Baekduia soli TaxID=496014 RepID=UPI001651E192|nr:AMP-dependent synthetase/ligase [Baekduia soli]
MSGAEATPGSPELGLGAPTLCEAFAATVRGVPDRLAIRTADGTRTLTWAAYDAEVQRCAAALAALGVAPGDRVALLLTNRPEFHVADAAVMRLGGVPFSVYATYSRPQIQSLLDDSGARLLMTEPRFADVVDSLVLVNPAGPGVIAVGGAVPGAVALEDLPAPPPPGPWPAPQASDVVTLIYTSGTTGPPKGVELTHGNAMAAARSFAEVIDLRGETRVISFLPMAHVAERNVSHYLPMALGFTTTCCPDPAQIYDLAAEVHPSWMFGVPRIWEKLQARIEAGVSALPEPERRAYRDAIARGTQEIIADAGAGRTLRVRRPGPEDAGVLEVLRRAHGLDRLRAAHTGAAPMAVHVAAFFHAIGVPLGELWGLSETTGGGTSSPEGGVRLGTVGRPSPGVELRIAADQEILVRGPLLMRGYHGRPDATAEAIDPDGWFHTGDLGALDDDGYLRLVGRKKEIIINSAGKNMSPALIEAELKAASPLLAHACVIGDARPYNVALLALDPDVLAATFGPEAAPGDAAVHAALTDAVERANARLARVEQIKRFHVAPQPWTPQDGLLTPTMKLRRQQIAAHHAGVIEALYAALR